MAGAAQSVLQASANRANGAAQGLELLRQKLPHFSAASQRLANLFYGPRSITQFKAGEARVLTWHWRHREAAAPVERVRLSAPQGDVWIAIERDHGFGLDPAVDWRELSNDARLLSWALNYESLLQHLRSLLGLALEPVAIVPAEEVTLAPVHCSLLFDIADAEAQPVLSGVVSFSPDLIGDDITVPGFAAKASARIELLPIPFQVVVTMFDVRNTDLEGVSIGDIVSLGAHDKIRAGARMTFESKNHAMRIAVRLGAAAARVETIETHQRPHAPYFQGSNQRASMPPSEEAASVATHVDALPVTLSFEAGEISLTVAELKALAPGAMLSFGRKLTDSPITVRANGRVLGIGELVMIDDFLGVRIVELRDHGSQ
jgi:type III secretion protein Q